MKTKLPLRLFGCVLLLSSCNRLSLPKNERVKENFLKEHPQCEVISVFVGEGDADHAYYHIRYKEANQALVKEVEWLYVFKKNSGWSVDKKLPPLHGVLEK